MTDTQSHKRMIADGIRHSSMERKISLARRREPPAKVSAEPDVGSHSHEVLSDENTNGNSLARWFALPRTKGAPKVRTQTLSQPLHLHMPSPRRHALWGALAGIVVMVIAGILLSTVLVSATVRIKSRIEIVTIQNVAVAFDTSIAQPVPEQKIVPAEHVHFTQTSTQEVPVHATAYVETRAKGIARIVNQYSTAPQRLVAQTRFAGPSGVIFRLSQSITVPGAVMEKGALSPRSVDVEIVADAPGEQGNLSGQIRLTMPGFQGTPKYAGFYAIAANGFSGGAAGMKKTASDADMQSAQQQVTKKVYDEIKAQMEQKIPPGLHLADGLRQIRIVKVDTVEQGDKLLVRADAEADALLFHEDDMVALLKNALLPKDNSKMFVDNSMNLGYAVQSLNFDQGRAVVLVQGNVKTRQPFTQTERDDLARALAGKKTGSAREYFNTRDDVTLSSISIFPSWRSALSSNPERIEIIEEQ